MSHPQTSGHSEKAPEWHQVRQTAVDMLDYLSQLGGTGLWRHSSGTHQLPPLLLCQLLGKDGCRLADTGDVQPTHQC